MKLRRYAWTLFLVMSLVSACGRGADEPPGIEILWPRDQYTMALGEVFTVESRTRDDRGISRIELRINGVLVALHEVPKGEKSYRVEQSWLPSGAGTYAITVIAYDSKDQASEPATITITVQPTPTVSLAPPPIPPPPTLPPTPASALRQPTDCILRAAFVTDVSIPDNTRLAPGSEFVKTWRLRNNGTCDWGPGFQFAFFKGEQMGGPAAVDLPSTPAGTTVDISVALIAPQRPGTYRGTWRMRSPKGQDFGDRPFVQIVVPGTSAPCSPQPPDCP